MIGNRSTDHFLSEFLLRPVILCFSLRKLTSGLIKMAESGEPCILCRRIAASQLRFFQMPRTEKGTALTQQKFPSPNRSVRSITCTVKNNGYAAAQSMLRHHGCRMGMMMLERKQRQIPFFRKACRLPGCRISRMKIACHRSGYHSEQLLHVLRSLQEGTEHLVAFHIAEILAHISPLPVSQAEASFQIPSHGKHRNRTFSRKGDRSRDKASAPPQKLRPPTRYPHQGIIQGSHNFSVIPRDSFKQHRLLLPKLFHFLIRGQYRFIRHIAAGHHQRPGGFGKHLMQPRVRKKGSQEPALSAHSRCKAVPALFQIQKHNRPGR